jgi:anaerobic selenocysteine-containing dehydrogenase
MHKRICPICEAACGLIIDTNGRDVIGIEANQDDVFSNGHICAKGIALKELDADPDRLRQPLIRQNGELVPCSWDTALELINSKLSEIRAANGNASVGSYIGNPTAHNVGLSMGLGIFAGTLGSPQLYSAGSVDQLPKQLASELMFGNDMAVPVPDIERCDYLLMLGANPAISNGSLWVVPKFRERLRQFQSRQGKLVTVDPRFSETARLADEHHFIRPGTDAYLLVAIANALLDQGATPPSGHHNWKAMSGALKSISEADASIHTGISIENIQHIARSMMGAEHPAVYGRVGTTLQRHGTLTSFLIEIVNLLNGSLDQPGGAMFPEQAFAAPGQPAGPPAYNRYQSRVSGYPEVMGQMPVAALAEEIETPGDGQIKALVCFAGNPVVSNPDSDRLARALTSLDFMVCVDIYHSETTKYADVILPGTSPFEDAHYDSFLGAMGYRNVARYSPPLFKTSGMNEWDIGITLAYITAHGSVPRDAERRAFEDDVLAATIARYTNDTHSPLHQLDVQEILGMIDHQGVDRMLDLGIRAGRWGDHFGKRDGLTLQSLIDQPDGIDLGELRSQRLSEVVKTPDGKLDLGPDILLTEIATLASAEPEYGLTLIGRRNAQTNNSWLSNLPMLTRGRTLCTLEMHPADAAEIQLQQGELAELTTPIGTLRVEVTISDNIAPGVVSLPHGFSEDKDLRQSNTPPGPNYNRLIASSIVDRPSGTSALNGISVSITKSAG